MNSYHYLIEGRDKAYSRLRDAKQAAKELSRKGNRIEVIRSDGRRTYFAKFHRITWYKEPTK